MDCFCVPFGFCIPIIANITVIEELHFQVSVPIGIAIWGKFCLPWGKSLCHADGFCLQVCSCICLKRGFCSVPFGKCIWNSEITYWFLLFEAVSLHVNRTLERLKPLKKWWFQTGVPIRMSTWGNFCFPWGNSVCHAAGVTNALMG